MFLLEIFNCTLHLRSKDTVHSHFVILLCEQLLKITRQRTAASLAKHCA